jgi:long-chain acyl-CoA synthetase
VPRFVEFRSQPLPKSNIGKVLRRQLREPVEPVPQEQAA